MRRQKALLGFIAAAAGVLLLFWGAHGPGRVAAVDNEAYEDVEGFADVIALVQKHYVNEVSIQDLVEGAVSGMLNSLDPHSAYLTQDLYKELQIDTEGSFGGLGIEITIRDGVLTVVSPIEDTPAYQVGIRAGDQIIKIEGDLTKDMPLVEAVRKMRGPKGTSVTISVRRGGG